MHDFIPTQDDLLGISLLFGVLGKSLSHEQNEEDIRRIVKSRVFTSVPFGGDQEEAKQGVALLTKWTKAQEADPGNEAEALDAIRHDFMYLFAGVGHPLASPWESTYFKDGGVMFEKQTLEVRDWYKRFDLAIELKNKEPDDHIGYELSFIAHLAELALKAAQCDDLATCEATLDSLRDFLLKHPLRWTHVWVKRVQEHARSDYYLGLALLVSGSLLALAATLNIDASGFKRLET